MPEAALSCPKCRTTWPADVNWLSQMESCPHCAREVRVELFPAFTRPVPKGQNAEAILIEGEAACFFHPEKKAVVPCSLCGRFLCSLCDLDFNGEHVCPGCLEDRKKRGVLKQLDTSRTVWDSAALSLTLIGPALCLWGTVITAPLAIIFAIYGWNKPGSLIPRTRARFVTAIVLGVLEVIGMGVMIYFIATS